VSSRDDGARDERAERAQAEEQAWREIVDHYGEVPVVPDDVEPIDPADIPADIPTDATTPHPAGTADIPTDAGGEPAEVPPEQPAELFRFEPYDEQFVPPPLPPPPDIPADRRFAWIGLIAPPVLLLIVVVLDYPLPGILTGALVVAFLGSFAYLVATMSTEPRDPDDDGARL
jgi:hypothetical protein